ncbi:MAG: hypothetical protein WAU60_03810 [Candidatus Competibacter denitrificans]
MISPYLVLAADPPLTLLSVGDSAPGLSYPLIIGLGAIRRPVDGSESGSVSLSLDNTDGQASQLLAIPPLRAPATLYGPHGSVWFRGVLSGVKLADTATLDLEG